MFSAAFETQYAASRPFRAATCMEPSCELTFTTMAPLPRRSNGSTADVSTIGPVAFTLRTALKVAASTSKIPRTFSPAPKARASTPAQLISRSSESVCSASLFAAAMMLCSSARSIVTRPVRPMSGVTPRADPKTVLPTAAKRCARARPKPRPTPVMKIRRPWFCSVVTWQVCQMATATVSSDGGASVTYSDMSAPGRSLTTRELSPGFMLTP